MNKHGNTKYKFDKLINIGDTITEKPNNPYSLKAAFRNYNLKRTKEGKPELVVSFSDPINKYIHIQLCNILPPRCRFELSKNGNCVGTVHDRCSNCESRREFNLKQS